MMLFQTNLAKSLRASKRGASMMEFAIVLPVLSFIGMGGLELSQYAMAIHKVNASANTLADNMSRVGARSALAATQLRERDVLDGFKGAMKENPSLNITSGRIILSSLERNPDGGQWIRWQRCIGTLNYPSSFGEAGDGATGTAFPGMGPTGSKIQTPPGTGQAVMFVEIAYDYTPMFSDMILPATRITANSAFLVRTPRDLSGTGIFNPVPVLAPPYTCNRHTAT